MPRRRFGGIVRIVAHVANAANGGPTTAAITPTVAQSITPPPSATTPAPPTIWFLTTTDTEGGRSHPARPPSVPSRVRFIGLSVQLPDSRPIARPTPHQPPNLQQHMA